MEVSVNSLARARLSLATAWKGAPDCRLPNPLAPSSLTLTISTKGITMEFWGLTDPDGSSLEIEHVVGKTVMTGSNEWECEH